MLNLVNDNILKYNLIEKNEKILIAISGGPDSVFLFHILYMLKEEYNMEIGLVHLNHMLRGEDADNDEKFVKDLAKKYDLKIHSFREDIKKYCDDKKLSFEEGARNRRYEIFDEVFKKYSYNKIALAQNKNDQAETVLMRLIRGSGIKGLKGMNFKRGNIIRPILNISKIDIEQYLNDNNLRFCVDKTNFKTDYTRNKIRLELIPYIEKEFNDNIVDVLFSTAEIFNEDYLFISKYADTVFYNIVKEKNINDKIIYEIYIDNLLLQDDSIIKRIIRKIIFILSSEDLKGFNKIHLNDILNLIKNKVNNKKYYFKDICININYDTLEIYIDDDKKELINNKDDILYYELKDINKAIIDYKNGKNFTQNEITIGDYKIKFNITKNSKIVANKNKIYIDLDKIKNDINIRNRKSGDKFIPFGMNGRKKLKDFFIDSKIENKLRDKILLLCDGNEIIWVVGYRMSELYRVTKDTKNVLQITVGENDTSNNKL